jgi:hypothetical protein
MSMDIIKLIAHIQSIAKHRHTTNGVCLFLGAGADISSNGILFHDLKKKLLLSEGYQDNQFASSSKIDFLFNQWISKLNPQERSEVLENLIRNSSGEMFPSDSYKLLVLLAKERIITSVITTNFDNMLEKSQDILHLDTFQIFAPGISIPARHIINTHPQKAVYLKMHGDIDGRIVTHLTEGELQNKEYEQEYIALFDYLISSHSIIFCGYSGLDHMITKLFKKTLDNVNQNRMQNVYWCNPNEPDQSSELVVLLKEKTNFTYIKINFDELLQTISKDIFSERMLFNADSVFIWPIIQSKIHKLQKKQNSSNEFIDKDERIKRLVIRERETEYLQDFLSNEHKNLCILLGDSGVGKTTFLTQFCDQYGNNHDINIIPIATENATGHGIISYIVEQLGYITINPLSVLYQFAQWADQQGYAFIFTIDGLSRTGFSSEEIVRNLNELFEYAYIIRSFTDIKFVVTMNSNQWNDIQPLININCVNDILWKDCQNTNNYSFSINNFTSDELKSALRKNDITHQAEQIMNINVKELLYNPFFFRLIVQAFSVIPTDFMDINTVYKAIDYLATRDYPKLKGLQIITNLEKLADQLFKADCDQIAVDLMEQDVNILENLVNNGILIHNEGYVKFRYDLFFSYYYSCKLERNQIYRKLNPQDFVSTYFNTNILNNVQSSIVIYFTRVDNYALVMDYLDKLLLYCMSLDDKSYISRTNKLISDIYESMAKYYPDKYCKVIDIMEQSLSFFERMYTHFCRSSHYLDDLRACSLLKHISKSQNKRIKLESSIMLMDRLAGIIKWQEHHQLDDCRKYLAFLESGNILIHAINIIWLASYFGPDNLSTHKYEAVVKLLGNSLCNILQRRASPSDYNDLQEYFITYSNFILFNSDNNLHEKYHELISRGTEVKLFKKILNGHCLTNEDFELIILNMENYNNNFIFLVCNFILIFSSLMVNKTPVEQFNEFYKKLDITANVSILDFFLSAFFMAMYLYDPSDRQSLSSQITMLVNNYEKTIFDNPGQKRYLSKNKFADQFDQQFEDGFNPLAFYFYTAPSHRYITNNDPCDNQEELALFWELEKILVDTGNYQHLLRLIHAVGQLIGLFPDAGMEALEHFIKYKEPILRKGLVRVLKENYLRYPIVTKKFLTKHKDYFAQDEYLEIVGAERSYLSERALEQLHYARIFTFLRNIFGTKTIHRMILEFLSQDNLSKAMEAFMEVLFDQDNSESSR